MAVVANQLLSSLHAASTMSPVSPSSVAKRLGAKCAGSVVIQSLMHGVKWRCVHTAALLGRVAMHVQRVATTVQHRVVSVVLQAQMCSSS